MKNRLFIMILVTVAGALYPESAYLKYHQAFGFKASNISGYGAFYGWKPTDDVRLQATGIYYLYDHKFQHERRQITDYSIGMEIQKDIIQEDDYRFYLMTGGYYYHDNDTSTVTKLHVVKNSYNCGLGIGYEYFFHRVTLGLELGYKYYYDTSEEKRGDGEWLPVLEKVTKIGAGLNLGFVF
jgi:hypothetical protein